MKTIIMPVGLPGSGKTTFLQSLRYKNSSYEDVDELFRKDCPKNKNTYKQISKKLAYSGYLILDGLFLNNKDITEFIDKLELKQYKSKFKLLIHYWNEDIDACLWNDKYRREISSEHSIKNKKLEPITILASDLYLDALEIIYHKVVRKPEYVLFAHKYKIPIPFKSDYWAVGGTRRGYNEYECNISKQDPVEFKEFDELLEKVYPDITFLKYKKLFSDCVIIDEYSDKDYYGGCVYYNEYVCDVEKLYNELKNLLAINYDYHQ